MNQLSLYIQSILSQRLKYLPILYFQDVNLPIYLNQYYIVFIKIIKT